MTQVIFDVVDLVGEVHPGDTVSVWPPHVTATVDGRVRSTRKIDVLVDEGPVTEDIEPGPLVVQLRCRGITDVKPRTVTIPDEGTITLANLLQGTFTYTPAVVSQVSLDAQRAEDAAVRAEAGAATVGDAQAVLDARDDTVAAVATLGDAQTVLGARDQAVQAAEDASAAAGDASAAAVATLGDAQTALTARDEAVAAAEDAEQIATTLPTTIESELGSNFVRKQRGETRYVYVREDGDDATGDGSHNAPFRQIQPALDSAIDGPVVPGSVIIDVGPGTYKGGTRAPLTRGTAQDDFLIIRGPSGGYPNVPSAVVSFDADTTQSRGFLFEDGLTVQLENIKIQGGFSTAAVQVARRCYLHMKNVHMDGMGVGTSGLSITASSYYVNGGCIIENFVDNGVQEFFGTTRTWTNGANTNEAAPIIRNCGTGFRSKEDCSGHLEFINFEDNNVAVEMHAWCTANVKGLRIVRNAVGIALINSEIHNEGGIKWGAGVDANSREIVSLGSSSELNTFGWDPASTLTTGAVAHRPLTTIAANYDTKVMTVATANAWLVPYNFTDVLRRGLYAVKGKKFRLTVTGRVFTPTADDNPFRLLMRVNGQISADIYMPGEVPAGTNFRLIVEVVATSDSNTQLVSGWLEGVAGTFRASARAHQLFGRDGTTVELQMTSATVGSRIDFLSAEVDG